MSALCQKRTDALQQSSGPLLQEMTNLGKVYAADQLKTPYFLNQPIILFQASSAASLR
jgi:hypothetical protein